MEAPLAWSKLQPIKCFSPERTAGPVRVPRHEAPGEAEAECARLQELGIVDAVWSDDSDTFMFGCTTLVQFHKPEGHEFKSEDSVLVYTANSLVDRSKLTREGLLMYAILVGCDYSDGLPGIGSSTLLDIAKHPKFQEAASLLAATVSNPQELSKWRAMIFRIVKDTFPGRNFALPPNTFPDPRILKNCSRPNISSDYKLRGLVKEWFRPFGPDIRARFRFLVHHFNSRKPITWPAEYLVPIELNHRLQERHGSRHANGPDYGIIERTAIGTRKKATINVDPLLVIPELIEAFPPECYDRFTGLPPTFNEAKATLLDCENVEKGYSWGWHFQTCHLTPRARTANAADRNRGTSERILTIGIDNDGESMGVNESRTRVAYKRRRVDVSSLKDIVVVDLTGAD
ncbi:XPG I-region-domain-containing protein [Hypoxylon crocopeplum]|nr:XPG I-region-domain-containing protein [Hypoxylon crocopeplum]